MAIRLSKLRASTVVPVPPPTAVVGDEAEGINPDDFPLLEDAPASETEQDATLETSDATPEAEAGNAILASLQGDSAQFGVFDDEQVEDYTTEEEEPDDLEEAWDDDDDDEDWDEDDDYYAMSPSERAASVVEESFSPDDDYSPAITNDDDAEGEDDDDYLSQIYRELSSEAEETSHSETDTDDEEGEEGWEDIFDDDFEDAPDNDLSETPPDDIARDADGAYVLKDADGEYFGWADTFLQDLNESEAMESLQPDDFIRWEELNEGILADDDIAEPLADEPDEKPATPAPPAQIGADDAVKGSSKGSSGGVKAFFLRALDMVAGALQKGGKIPLLGRLFKKSVPGTPTGRGMAGVVLAILVFLLGGFINGQITGDRVFSPSGSSSVELADNGKVTVTGVARKDGGYYAVLKNEGSTNAHRVYGSVHASGSEAYNPLSWFNKADLGTCTFRADTVKAGAEVQIPLSCDADMSGKGSMSFTELTIESEEV
jgi:hypothetical protein